VHRRSQGNPAFCADNWRVFSMGTPAQNASGASIGAAGFQAYITIGWRGSTSAVAGASSSASTRSEAAARWALMAAAASAPGQRSGKRPVEASEAAALREAVRGGTIEAVVPWRRRARIGKVAAVKE